MPAWRAGRPDYSFVDSINHASGRQPPLPAIENVRPGLLRGLRVIHCALGKTETMMRARENLHGVRSVGFRQSGAQVRNHVRRHRLVVLGKGIIYPIGYALHSSWP